MMSCLEWHREAVLYNVRRNRTRLDKLYRALTSEFPTRDSHHMSVLALIDIYFPRTVRLILLGENALAYIEIHAVFESFLLSYLPKKLARNEAAREIISEQIERKNLPELATAAQTLGLWTRDDVAFVKHLTRIRNALAHRNYDLLHRVLGSPTVHDFELPRKLDETIDDRDASGDFIRTLRLIIKFTRHKRQKAANQQIQTIAVKRGSV